MQCIFRSRNTRRGDMHVSPRFSQLIGMRSKKFCMAMGVLKRRNTVRSDVRSPNACGIPLEYTKNLYHPTEVF
jgi:hypothetical protein